MWMFASTHWQKGSSCSKVSLEGWAVNSGSVWISLFITIRMYDCNCFLLSSTNLASCKHTQTHSVIFCCRALYPPARGSYLTCKKDQSQRKVQFFMFQILNLHHCIIVCSYRLNSSFIPKHCQITFVLKL